MLPLCKAELWQPKYLTYGLLQPVSSQGVTLFFGQIITLGCSMGHGPKKGG